MARVCTVTGRHTHSGGQIARRGLAKAKGGVGLKTTGVSKRKFKANIQKIRVVLPAGTVTRVKLSTKAIKSGVIRIGKGVKSYLAPLNKASRGRKS